MSRSNPRIYSPCARSPWFDKTWNGKAFYGEYAGRLVLMNIVGATEEEYWCLRRQVGLYDVPERPVEISGPDATEFLNRALTRPVDRLRVGRGSYGLLCHKGGGLVCDGILFRLAEERFWYVHADADVFTWLSALALDYRVEIRDPQSWVLQVQGPRSLDVLARACDDPLPAEFRYFDVFEARMGGQPVLVSRTGWTAELGIEIYNLDPAVDGSALWDHLVDAGSEFGIRAAGQFSMNVRRIEAGILNYPTDIDWSMTPFDAGLGDFVDLDGHDFVGRDALLDAPREARLTGFHCRDGNPRSGSIVYRGDTAVGRVTAFDHSPYFGHSIGFVRFDSAGHMQAGDLHAIDREGNRCTIELQTLPFYDAEKRIPRGLEPVDGGLVE